ncbi:serine/threonine protein kinase [Sphaerospermopsis sp. FACHB-1094]|uniref:serine/threonine-protein kinase n=1 Tax=Sphaerospermopsis sp. FACHB-1094 TaxID=2692861 RepID=UPI0016869F8A|nr:serine/threonine-protein kinase [Sphaerospermopsis sp. FACHB-1094]MBD2135858.1 serine/threonine protein kinase [Sphaerospermopsis sp. FACHB-1094]
MIGTVLKGRYSIIKQIGSGGFGETYIAEDNDIPSTPKPKCVVKRLKPQVVNSEVIRLFEQEAKVLLDLGNNHDRIPKLHAYFELGGQFFLVQDLIEGQDLSHELLPGRPWQEADVITLLIEILSLISHIHQHQPPTIHRDIKPENIIRRASDGKLILIDFGAVKQITTLQINAHGQTIPTVSIGTPGYMPNEQASGRPRLASDVYAVGMIALQALTGIFPHQFPEDPDTGEIFWQSFVNISPDFAAILNKMVRYQVSERYSSAVEALQALSSLNQTTQHLPQQVTTQQNKTLHLSQQITPKQKTLPLRIITVVVAVITMSVVVCAGLFFRGSVLDNPTGEEHTPPKQEPAY